MASSDPITIRKGVFAIMQAALPDFTCTWGFSTRNPPRHWAYMGDISWPQAEWATNRSRQMTLSIPIVLNVLKVRTQPEDVEIYLQAQFDALIAAFGPDSDIRNSSVVTWQAQPRQLGTQPNAEGIEGQAVIEIQVTYRP